MKDYQQNMVKSTHQNQLSNGKDTFHEGVRLGKTLQLMQEFALLLDGMHVSSPNFQLNGALRLDNKRNNNNKSKWYSGLLGQSKQMG